MSTEFFNDQWRIPSNENQNKISNYSMEFDGSSDYIDAGTGLGDSLGTYTGDASISLWFKADTTTSNEGLFTMTPFNGSDFGDLRINISSNILYFVSSALTSYKYISFTDTASWHHLVCIFKSGDITNSKIYLDGVDKTTTDVGTFPSSLSLTGLKTIIGAYRGTSNTFNGKIDQVTFFDYALSQDQVTQLGAQGYAFASGGSLSGSIDLANPVALGTSKTVSFWFKLSSSATFSFSPFTAINNSGNCYYPYFISSSSTYKWYLSDSSCGGTGSFNLGSGGAVERNKWVHAAVVGNATNVKCYINGIKVNDDSNADRNPIIQRLIYGATQLIEFSNFSIFNTNLPETGTESISSLYNNGNPPDLTNYSNIIHWWKLDDADTFDGADWTVTDYIGSNTGTSNGMNASNLVASNINGELIANPMSLSPAPVAYYQLGDQSVYNGGGYLVPNNSLSDYVFDFNSASSNYIDLGAPFSFTENLSVSLWMKSTQTATNTFVGKDINSSGKRNWMVMLYQNKVYFWTTSTGNISNVKTIQSTVAGAVTDGKWHHVVCVNNYANSTKQIYIDGDLDISNNEGELISTSSIPVQIGKRPSGFPYDGEMSNVAVWNSALTGPQITTLYNNGAPNDISSLNPTAWYKLNASEIFNSTSTEWSVDNNAYPSVYKSSLNFNGNDYINCGTNSRFNIDQVTISAWVKRNSSIGNFAIAAGIRNAYNGPTPYMINLTTASSKLIKFVITQSNSTGIIVNSNTLIEDDIWYHVVGVADGSNVQMYVNGDLQTDQKTYDGTIISPNQNFNIGRQPSASTYYWDGELSNVAVFDTGLSLSQVETLYNNGTPEASISHSPLSWWKLDNTTTGIQDSAGSNDGASNGATEYAGFVNSLAGESSNMDSSNLVVSDLQQTSGYSPYALDFDGVNDYLDANRTVASNLDFSVSAWINPKSYAMPILGTRGLATAGTSNGFTMNINSSGNLWGRVFTETSNIIQVQTGSTISLNNWSHVGMTYNSSSKTLKTYLNGSEVGSIIGTDSSVTSTANLDIGRSSIGTLYGYFDGELSNVSIFNTELTSTEVTEIYNEGVPSNLNNFSGTAPVSWWQIGSNSSFNTNWTCLDETGTNNAVSVNMTNSDIVDGPGYSASGLGTSSIDIKGDAPYSTANGLSENMDVLDRVTDVAPS